MTSQERAEQCVRDMQRAFDHGSESYSPDLRDSLGDEFKIVAKFIASAIDAAMAERESKVWIPPVGGS